MTYEEAKKRLRFASTPKQDAAAKYLERNGKKFGVHFGYENAIDEARRYRLLPKVRREFVN